MLSDPWSKFSIEMGREDMHGLLVPGAVAYRDPHGLGVDLAGVTGNGGTMVTYTEKQRLGGVGIGSDADAAASWKLRGFVIHS